MQLIQATRANICWLLEQCNVVYEITPFDEDLYQECVDEAIRRGYTMDGDPSLQTYLRGGIVYAATAGAHLPHRPTQIWLGLYTACILFIDDVIDRFPEEMPNIYLFNERFISRESQGNGILDALADVIRRVKDIFRPVASQLITTAALNFVTSNLLEYETTSMEISSAAQEYPAYQRVLSGSAGVYAFIVFPREIPLNHYVQAIPEIMLFINNVNDVMSFYKEELVGETVNQVSNLAARTNKSKLEALAELTESTIDLYKKIVKILEGSPEACEAFKNYTPGYVRFHTSLTRYRLEDLDLQASH